jgi:small subunit ribosomal protein S20
LFNTKEGNMASHKSARKSIRKSLRQRAVNVNRISRIRTFIKKVESAMSSSSDKNTILSAFSDAQKEIMRGTSKKVLHKNAASRKISRLARKVKLAIGNG